jgi:signal transduction histidine kinase
MQDIYQQRSNWKIILAGVGMIILLITLFYSNYLAKNLEKNELKNAVLFRDAIDFIFKNPDPNADIQIQDYIVNSFALPTIIKDDQGGLSGFNFSENENGNQEFLKSKIKEFLDSGQKPLIGAGYAKEVYTFKSKLLDYVRYFPIVQLFLLGSFIALGYFLFNSSKRAEQNRVWAGMAKETAHQLGTPISAIIGWISLLKENYKHDAEINEVASEMEEDIERLNLIADRFSKIGSAPELKSKDIVEEVSMVIDYMKKRTPKNINFELKNPQHTQYFSNLNSHLFEWVIENLIRNSLDAMDGKGNIQVLFYTEDNYNCIDLIDSGKGIPQSKFKTVFNPGYSTKQRGWGLGLSLAKRIIEEYHKGKIFVKSSKLDEGTTFTIRLKK